MKLKIILVFIIIVIIAILYFDPFHKSSEPIQSLVGKNYDYAVKIYFKSDPDASFEVNINELNSEFHNGIIAKKSILVDSIISIHTWFFFNHKSTLWIGKTKNQNNEIIDALRYKNNVVF